MPQERHDARRLERELKIKFEWREADKNLEKEERNKPLDLNSIVSSPGAVNKAASGLEALLALETRSWRGDANGQAGASANGGRSDSRGRRRGRKGPGGRANGKSGQGGNKPRSGSRPNRGERG
jgi:ATP-dependent RNA helicase RhlE